MEGENSIKHDSKFCMERVIADMMLVKNKRLLRGHVQTFFGKINVIMTFKKGGQSVTLTFLFVYCFLFVNCYSKILLQFCQLYSTGHFIADMTLYQMLESGKNTSLHRPDDRGNVSYHRSMLILSN